MSADVLREAARVMRERAEAATPGVWISSIEGRDHFGGDNVILTSGDDLYPAVTIDHQWNRNSRNDQDHIASWHPAVALAVADWLDEAADHLEDHSAFPADAVCPTALEGLDCSVLGQAVTVARAYLGDPS